MAWRPRRLPARARRCRAGSISTPARRWRRSSVTAGWVRLTLLRCARQSRDCWRGRPAMAEDLASVRARIRGVRQLDAVIGAMRGIAAAHAQQSRALLPGFHAYADVVAHAIAQALRLRDDDTHRAAGGASTVVRVVFCAEQGFVGGFAEHVLEAAAARGPGDVFLVGSRGLLLGAAHGIAPVWQSAMATQIGGIS